MKECFIPYHLVSFLFVMCSRLDEHEALFARVPKMNLRQSDAYSMYYVGISGVRERLMECIKWNALHMLYAEAKFLKKYTHAHKCSLIIDILFLIFAKTEVIPKSQLFYSNKQIWRKSSFALSQTMAPIHPSVNTYHTKMIPNDLG